MGEKGVALGGGFGCGREERERAASQIYSEVFRPLKQGERERDAFLCRQWKRRIEDTPRQRWLCPLLYLSIARKGGKPKKFSGGERGEKVSRYAFKLSLRAQCNCALVGGDTRASPIYRGEEEEICCPTTTLFVVVLLILVKTGSQKLFDFPERELCLTK